MDPEQRFSGEWRRLKIAFSDVRTGLDWNVPFGSMEWADSGVWWTWAAILVSQGSHLDVCAIGFM